MNDEALIPLFLEDRDSACPACGYNLRGVTVPACPECGSELAIHPMSVCLAVDIDRSFVSSQLGLYRMSVAGLVVPAAGVLLMSVAIVASPGGRSGITAAKVAIFIAALVHPVLIAALVKYKPNLLRLSKGMWYAISLACWYWVILPAIVFIGVTIWSFAVSLL